MKLKLIFALLLFAGSAFALTDACVQNTNTILNSTNPFAINSSLNYTVFCQQDISPLNSNITLNSSFWTVNYPSVNLSVNCLQAFSTSNAFVNLNSTNNSFFNQSLNFTANCTQDPLNWNVTLNSTNQLFRNDTYNVTFNCTQSLPAPLVVNVTNDGHFNLSLNYTVVVPQDITTNQTFSISSNSSGCLTLFRHVWGTTNNISTICPTNTTNVSFNDFSSLISNFTSVAVMSPTYYNYSVTCALLNATTNLTLQQNLTVNKCVLNLNLTSTFSNDTNYSYFNDTCAVNITIPGFEYPNGMTPVDSKYLTNLTNIAGQCVDLLNQTGSENITLLASRFTEQIISEKTQRVSLQKIIDDADLCTIPDTELLKGYKSLPEFEKRYFSDLTKVYGQTISYPQFADIIQADFATRGDALYYANVMLEDYGKAKLAIPTCQTNYDPTMKRNVTSCVYTSNVIPTCINRTASLLAISDMGYSDGQWSTILIVGVLLAIILAISTLYVLYPGVFPSI